MNLIFGCGSNGYEYLKKSKIKINYFSDSNPNLWNRYIGKIKIINPNEIKHKKIKHIIVCTPAYTEILEILKKKKFKGKISIFTALRENKVKYPKLLYTSHSKNGGVIELNIETNTHRKIISGRYRGIKKIENKYLVADERNGLILFNKNFKKLKTLKLPLWHNSHGITYNSKTKIIYLAVTGLDEIYVIKYPSFKLKYKISFSNAKLNPDSFHINSVLYSKRKLYISMFSKKGTWKNNKWDDGTIGYYKNENFKKFYVVKTKLKQPHSLIEFKNEIFFCNSINYEVQSLRNYFSKLNGYTRGLYIDDEIFAIGYSKSRNLDRFLKINDFKNDFASISIYNKKNNTYKILLTKVDQIFDIIKK